jgi:putative N6-adenine-specific DNA methylase
VEYIKNQKYFAQVAGCLEKHAAEELTGLGATVIQEIPRGVRFSCDQRTLYRIIYCSRLIQRVLAPIISFQCHSEKYLYNQALNNIDWTAIFTLQDTFAIVSNVSSSNIQNSLYAGQVLKDAICDQFRAKYDARPDFSVKEADLLLNLHIHENMATISFDVAGASLHKRGYRQSFTMAPLQETLAAAVIKLSGWDGTKPLYDIMCGSGTILTEALMHYCRIPAGYLRKDKGIAYLPDFAAGMWEEIKKQENSRIIPLPDNLIFGSDISSANIADARKNLSSLPYGERVQLKVIRFEELPKGENRCIITNPPYGVRLGNDDSTRRLYNDLGDFLKQNCPASESYILCGSNALVAELRLRAHWKKALKNGDIETKLAKIIVR